ncbi:MAG: hypothetical protein PHX21_12750 [bacterium]|nr:hypothetical protein [bacterium]
MKLEVKFLADTKNPNHIHIRTNPESVKKLEEVILKKLPFYMQPMVKGRLKALHDNNDYRLPKRAILDWGGYILEIEVVIPKEKGGVTA